MRFLKYLLYPIALVHLFLYYCSPKETKRMIDSDIEEMGKRCKKLRKGLLYWLVFEKPYRNLFYFRLPCASRFSFILPPYRLFTISCQGGIGEAAFVLNHPYATIINAKKIGHNFTVCQLTTIGNKIHGRNDLVPTIGDNVTLCSNVTIIGDIKIGNNVIVGAGSVVVKDVPDNCVVAGNPAKILRKIN